MKHVNLYLTASSIEFPDILQKTVWLPDQEYLFLLKLVKINHVFKT